VPNTAVTSTAIKEGVIEKGRASMEERAISNVTLLGVGNRQIFAREFEITTSTLYDVVILYEGPGQTIKSKLTAKKARFEEDHWVFRDVMKYQLKPDGDISGEPVYATRLELDIEERPADFIRETSTVEFMSSKELRRYIGNFKGGSQKRVRRLTVDFYYKIAFPFVSFVVMLIGAPLAMRSVRGNAMVGIGTSLGVVLLYYGVHSACLAMGKGGLLPPFLSAWSANIAFALVGAWLIRETS
jgi:lipopolysaccharide export system permease protein